MLAAQQRLQSQDYLVIGTTISTTSAHLEASHPCLRGRIMLSHRSAALRGNQGKDRMLMKLERIMLYSQGGNKIE